jgi:hypothetical protein
MNEKIIDVVVHEFTVDDVEDPIVYAADPLLQWQKTEQGKWVLDNSTEMPTWHRTVCYDSYGYRFIIVAKMTESLETYFNLKWK